LNLVLQGPTLKRDEAAAVVSMAQASTAETITANAFRLRKAKRNQAIAPYCEARSIDYGWVPEGRRFADLKLLAMDMDSTLITIECIDELGDLAGKKAEVAAITAQAMRGELDYPASLRRRVAALAGLAETSLLEVYEKRLKLTPGADVLIQTCKKHGVKLLLVSGGFNFFAERLKQRLGLDYTISNRLEIQNGRLSGNVLGDIVDAEAKAAKFRAVMHELGAKKDETLAIGDGANDLRMMAEAGLSIAFRAKPVVRAKADCALTHSGLDGVVNLLEP
jgi:phosphoserine phosphatase